MLNSLFKTTFGVKLKGNQPMPDDDVLSVVTYEAMHYLAMRTTPKSLIIKSDVADDELQSLRTIEEGYYIRLPEVPDFTGSEPTEILDMDEELSYALMYYSLFVFVKDKSGVPEATKNMYYLESDRLLTIFESNFTRAGGSLYDTL